MLLFVYTTTRKGFVIFICRYFNTTALSQSNCGNLQQTFWCFSLESATDLAYHLKCIFGAFFRFRRYSGLKWSCFSAVRRSVQSTATIQASPLCIHYQKWSFVGELKGTWLHRKGRYSELENKYRDMGIHLGGSEDWAIYTLVRPTIGGFCGIKDR